MAAAYITDADTLAALRRVNSRIFDESRPLRGDERRDLANLMYVLLDDSHFWPVKSAHGVEIGESS